MIPSALKLCRDLSFKVKLNNYSIIIASYQYSPDLMLNAWKLSFTSEALVIINFQQLKLVCL